MRKQTLYFVLLFNRLLYLSYIFITIVVLLNPKNICLFVTPLHHRVTMPTAVPYTLLREA
jgi:hypothetical protein